MSLISFCSRKTALTQEIALWVCSFEACRYSPYWDIHVIIVLDVVVAAAASAAAGAWYYCWSVAVCYSAITLSIINLPLPHCNTIKALPVRGTRFKLYFKLKTNWWSQADIIFLTGAHRGTVSKKHINGDAVVQPTQYRSPISLVTLSLSLSLSLCVCVCQSGRPLLRDQSLVLMPYMMKSRNLIKTPNSFNAPSCMSGAYADYCGYSNLSTQLCDALGQQHHFM